MARWLLTRSFDALLHPQIKAFSLRHALRMSKRDLLRGSAQAAQAMRSAHQSGLRGDPRPLAELAECGSLEPSLHDFLSAEVEGRVEAMAELDGAAPHGMKPSTWLLEVENGGAAPQLDAVRLIVGARRSTYDTGSDRFVRKHKCTLGSHLVVVANRSRGLWTSDVQRELLLEEGCTVQCTVGFKTGHAFSSRQQYTLEAELAGPLLDPAMRWHLDSADESVRFQVVDLNGALAGNEFWAGAEEVAGLQRVILETSGA